GLRGPGRSSPPAAHAEPRLDDQAPPGYCATMSKRLELDLRDLGRICRLSPGALANCAEAASVMLDKFWAAPPPPTPASVVSDGAAYRPGCAGPGVAEAADLWWTGPDDEQRGTHANEVDATRDGAYAVAIAAVHTVHGYV